MPAPFKFTFTSPLPPEIITDILTRSLALPPVCGLHLLCPDWSLCHRRHPVLEAALRCTRVDTYTLPPPQQHRGTVETRFDHCHAAVCDGRGFEQDEAGRREGRGRGRGGSRETGDCIPLPVLRDPRGGSMEGLPARYQRELVRAWYVKFELFISLFWLMGAVSGATLLPSCSSYSRHTQRGMKELTLLDRAGRSVMVVSQRFESLGPLWREIPREVVEGMLLLREEDAVGLLPFEDDLCETGTGAIAASSERGVFWVDGREKETLPRLSRAGTRAGDGEDKSGPSYLFQRIRHLVVNTVPALAEVEVFELGMLPSTWGAEVSRNLVYLEARLEYERKANLRLRWDALERLESLFLDLRGYSLPTAKYLFDEDVLRLAWSLSGMGLELLVIAGLRSWERLYPGPDALTIEEVEGGSWDLERQVWVDEANGGINWWKMFERAVKPGGRLILVDKDAGRANDLRLLQPGRHYGAMLGY